MIERELSTKVGDIFNRNKLELDIKRLYSTSLFNDVKVTLKPVKSEPGKIIIVLGITEQRTGSLTGGYWLQWRSRCIWTDWIARVQS